MQTVLKYDNVISCANTIAIMEEFVVLKEINYICMVSSQNRFVLSITVNSFKCEKVLCFLCKGKKAPHGSFYKNK